MNTHAFEKKLHSLKARFGLQLFVLAAVVCTSWIVTDHANAVYILTGPEDAAIVLNEEEVREGEMSSQLVYLSSGQSGYDMALTAGQEVTVTHDGSTVTAKARSETVAELLERLHITPSPLEMVAVDLDEDSAELTIASELTYYDQVEEPATYETVRVANPSLPKGTEKVVQEGTDGVRTSIYEVVWSGGEEISRQFVEELESTAVNEVVEYGTAVASTRAGVASVSKNTDGSGILTLTDGTTLNFSGVKSMTATAYTAGHGGADYTTATGTLVKVGTVAVDKNVIPLGTKMYIVAADGLRGLRHRRGGGYRRAGKYRGPVLRHLSAVHQLRTADVQCLYPGVMKLPAEAHSEKRSPAFGGGPLFNRAHSRSSRGGSSGRAPMV